MTPEPIEAAPPFTDTSPLLLFCPEQGGLHSGVWFYGKWLAYIDSSIILHPTHWMMAPVDPEEVDLAGCVQERRQWFCAIGAAV
jgi:hypothetical protein